MTERMTDEERDRIVAEAKEFGFEQVYEHSGLKCVWIRGHGIETGIANRECWQRFKRLLAGEEVLQGFIDIRI